MGRVVSMIKSLIATNSSRLLLFILVFLILTSLAILFDIPVVRQFSGFIFLTFIPGFLLLSILKLNKLGLAEKIVLSVGLSVAFSMLFGLALNTSLPAAGYTKPLSTASLLISFSIATIVLAIVAYMRNLERTKSIPLVAQRYIANNPVKRYLGDLKLCS